MTLSQSGTANLGGAWALEQIQNCLFGFCGWFCGAFFQLGGGGGVVFHRHDTSASLSKERSAEPTSRRCLTLGRTGPWELCKRILGEKICFVFAQSYSWERKKLTQPAVVMNFIRIRAWENHSGLPYCGSSKSGKGDTAEILCPLNVTVTRTSNLRIHIQTYAAPHLNACAWCLKCLRDSCPRRC